MPFKLDPEIAAGLGALFGGQEPAPPPKIGDYLTRRTNMEVMFGAFAPPIAADVSTKDYHVSGSDSHKILLRWFTKQGAATNSPAILYLHGGGYIGGTVDMYNGVVAKYVEMTGVPLLSVDYRLAPEFQYPTNVDDAHKGLLWLVDHASELGIDAKRIAVMGDSGGGGLAAALTHYNIEKKGPEIAKQILIYPMLDDRNIVTDTTLQGLAVWTEADNETGWGCLLGSKRGAQGLPPSAAPARVTDPTGVPPAYIDTGELDIFRNEDLEYATKLGKFGISAEMHVYPGCPHAFDAFCPTAKISQAAMANRYRAILTIDSIASVPKL